MSTDERAVEANVVDPVKSAIIELGIYNRPGVAELLREPEAAEALIALAPSLIAEVERFRGEVARLQSERDELRGHHTTVLDKLHNAQKRITEVEAERDEQEAKRRSMGLQFAGARSELGNESARRRTVEAELIRVRAEGYRRGTGG